MSCPRLLEALGQRAKAPRLIDMQLGLLGVLRLPFVHVSHRTRAECGTS